MTENQDSQATRLRDWLNIDSAQSLDHDLSSTVKKKMENTPSTSPLSYQNRLGEKKRTPKEEIVKHMSNLPSYLEKGDNFREKSLSLGVLDWRRLEKWQHNNKQTFSPLSSNHSSYFSTDISSTHSSRGLSCSSGETAVNEVDGFHVLENKLNNPAKREHILYTKYQSFTKSPEFKPKECQNEDIEILSTRKPKTQNGKPTRQVDLKYSDSGTNYNYHEKGKNKILSNDFGSKHHGARQVSSNVKFPSESFESPSRSLKFQIHPLIGEKLIYSPKKVADRSEPKIGTAKNHKLRNTSLTHMLSRRSNSLDLSPEAVHSKTEEKKDVECSGSEIPRLRNPSPTRRFRYSRRSSSLDKSSVPCASSEHEENSSNDKPSVGRKSQTSPLRRLMDPLLKPKTMNCAHSADSSEEDSEKLYKSTKNKSSTVQALVQMSIRNGLPLFTFADDKNSGVLAATIKKVPTSKTGACDWLYTFFNVNEVKKKKGWINKGCKGETNGYNPSVIAQMKVSDIKHNRLNKFRTREFVSFSVDLSENDNQTSNFCPKDELAAILVKFPKEPPSNSTKNNQPFSITVILPGGSHALPSKGKPSPLIERWKSGGMCDCGGWDLGCRLKILSSLANFDGRSNFSNTCQAADRVELFLQDEVVDNKFLFIMSPFKDHIYSVEFDSTLSFLQAFSICISVLNCRKPYDFTELGKLYEGKMDNTSMAGDVLKGPNLPL